MARSLKIWLPLAAMAIAMAAMPSTANALRIKRSAGTDDLSFSGDTCGQQVAASYALPRRSSSAKLTRAPNVGDGLRDFLTGGVVARVTSRQVVKSGGRRYITVTGVGSDAVCTDPDSYLAGWTTEDFTVRAKFRQRVRVGFSGSTPDFVQRHPRTLFKGANGYLTKLRWRGWDSKVARTRGILPYNDCVPYCARGRITPYRIKIRLSRPKLCAGRYRYLTLRYKILGRRVPKGYHRSNKETFGFVCNF